MIFDQTMRAKRAMSTESIPATDPAPVTDPWPVDEPRSLTLANRTMVEALAATAARLPDRTALFYYGATLDYAGLAAAVERLAAVLVTRFGVGRGDRVLIALQNSPQYVIAYHAVLRADAVAVPVNPMYRSAELSHILTDSGARVAILGDELVESFAPLSGADGPLETVIAAHYDDMAGTDPRFPKPAVMTAGRASLPDGWHDWRQVMAQETAPLPPAAGGREDLCLMPYTSGSTGRPKACMHTHLSVLFTAEAQQRLYRMTAEDVVTAFLTLFHVAGMQASMNAALVAGCEIVLMTRWDRDLVPVLLAGRRVSFWNAAPAMVVDVLGSDNFDPACLDRVRVLTGGGAAMPEAVAAELKQRYGLTFIEGYGMTETMSPTHMNPMHAPRPQCLGIPIHDTDARIVDPDTLAELPVGETGEIVVAGPQILKGYWRRPEADAEAFFERDGKRFLRTGDLGRRDAAGYFYAVDRLKRMINVGGFKAWPAEIETTLFRHPAIRDACIISVPDDRRGEAVKAVIVLKAEAKGRVTAEDIITWARGELAAYKVPRFISFAEDLPRTATNKVDWRGLQEAERGRLRQTGP